MRGKDSSKPTKPPEYPTYPLSDVMDVMYLIALSVTSSGTSIPAFRAASNPTSTAPLTEVSASLLLGEYLHAPSEFSF